jgi:hypothetical protein
MHRIRHNGPGGGIRRSELPEDYGPRHSVCPRCGCFLNRYHSPTEDGGLCYPCAPGGEGVVIEVAPGEYRRFHIVKDEDLVDLMEAA